HHMNIHNYNICNHYPHQIIHLSTNNTIAANIDLITASQTNYTNINLQSDPIFTIAKTYAGIDNDEVTNLPLLIDELAFKVVGNLIDIQRLCCLSSSPQLVQLSIFLAFDNRIF